MNIGGGDAPNASPQSLAAMGCRPGRGRLADDELRLRLASLPGWTHAGERIEKTFHFSAYGGTIAFVNAVAAIAQREDHHPELSVHYDRCVVSWSTHSARAVTLNDCICAAKVDSIKG